MSSAERLRLSLTRVLDADLTATLAETIRETADHFDLATGESPSSTVTIAHETGEYRDLLVLGGSLAIVPGEIITDERMDRPDLEARTKYRQRLAVGSGYDDQHRRLLRELQDQQDPCRNRIERRAGGIKGVYGVATRCAPRTLDPAEATHTQR
ncbi:hypothetical protein [Haloechinothrix sp. LS1_15]|uniref:hypothetical protein n=1 Tax=Haloechinothrix sp. LS1_15 TaxID=2652248 RepID=UPI0029469069|nr:hypothetical protein [Haloechinothrix sp. LS1_15]MDV6012402.1 hypothetical protein [Haloechinothrix sp. LS1_15]